MELLDRMNPKIDELTVAAERKAKKRVGPLTALAYVLIIGTPARFSRSKQIGTYVRMIPSEKPSGGKQRLGHFSKQGNANVPN